MFLGPLERNLLETFWEKEKYCLLSYEREFQSFNSLPNDKILELSKLKVCANDKISVTEKLQFVLGRIENIVGKD